jgi:hypothetical protein
MKLDSTTLRLIRAASQAVADECTAILSEAPLSYEPPFVGVNPEAAAEAPAPATPAKRTRKPAAAPEPVVVTTTPPVTNIEQSAAPAPAAPAPAAVTLFNPPPQSTVTDEELATHANQLKEFPDKLRAYQAWRDSSEFLQPDGTLASGKGLPLSKIPNVGDNRDRLLDAIKRALV